MDQPKRRVSVLIPYRKESNEWLVYLQKRAKDAVRLPDYFGFFGGGIEEGEAPEEALLREMKEELNFVPTGYRLFGEYEYDIVYNVFALAVGADFETKVTILEGDYGRWFNEAEIEKEERLITYDKRILRDFFSRLHSFRNATPAG